MARGTREPASLNQTVIPSDPPRPGQTWTRQNLQVWDLTAPYQRLSGSPGSTEPGWVLAAREPGIWLAQPHQCPSSHHRGDLEISGNVASSTSELRLAVVRRNLFFRLTSESSLFL